MRHLRLNNGFTLIEVMIAMVILSVALLSTASTTVSVIKGNQVSDRVTEAVALTQDTIEELRNKNFYLGADGAIGGGDDVIDTELLNSNTGNDNTTAAADLFASPDHAYQINADGSETTTTLNSPALTTSVSYLRRSWIIKDNATLNTKTVTVVVGWVETGFNRYVAISTVIAGMRYSGMPGTI